MVKRHAINKLATGEIGYIEIVPERVLVLATYKTVLFCLIVAQTHTHTLILIKVPAQYML